MTGTSLLREHFFCDGHADTFGKVVMLGADFLNGKGNLDVTLERLVTAGQNLQLMAIFVPPGPDQVRVREIAFRMAMAAHVAVRRSRGRFALIRSRATLGQAPCAVMLTLEGADPLMGDLRELKRFYDAGIRAVGLTHNHNSCAAGGCDPPDGVRIGLTDFGRRLIPEMERLGILLDTAHLGRQAFYEALDAVTAPIVNSHCCSAALVDIERNVTDEQLRLIADTGGLSAVTFVPRFVKAEGAVTSQDVFRHLEHMAEVAGIDHVAIGSDFDGTLQLPADLHNPTEVHHLVEHMQNAGWREDEISKVVGGNWFRVLSQVLR